MVRLKVIAIESSSTVPIFQFLMVRLKAIRTIKVSAAIAFQFLMVRLKVIIRKPVNPNAIISIPYGSIKSLTTRLPTTLRMLRIQNFNSLWFD